METVRLRDNVEFCKSILENILEAILESTITTELSDNWEFCKSMLDDIACTIIVRSASNNETPQLYINSGILTKRKKFDISL